jgi:uncharacterized membrane protein YbhN (UPF0104 family)
MTTRGRQLIKLLLRIAVTVGLLAWLFSQESIRGGLWHAMKTARWEFLLPVWLLTLLYFWVSSLKLQLILKQQGIRVSVGIIFGASAIAALYGMVMPGILSTAAKWYILEKDTGKGSAVFSSMLYNQLSITVVMTVFGLVGLMITNPTSVVLPEVTARWVLPTCAGLLLVFVVATSLLLLNGRAGGWILRKCSWWFRPLPVVIRARVEKVSRQVAVLQSAGARFHVTIVAVTVLASCIIGVLIYVFSAQAANVHAPLGVLIWLSAIIYLLGRLPISLANLGVREVTLVGFLALYGIEKSGAMVMSMILFSTSLLMAAFGAAYQVGWSAGAGRRQDKRLHERQSAGSK